MRAALVAAALAAAAADQTSFDCEWRKEVLRFAAHVQPHRELQDWQNMADALNGADNTAPGCHVSPDQASGSMPRHDIAERRAVAKGPVVYADARLGKDSNKGTIDSPVATVGRAVELSRSAAAPGAPRSVSLRQGYFYVPSPVELGPADSGLSIAPFAGETAVVSGAAPLDVEWLAHNVGPDPVYPSGARQWLYRDDITAVGSSPVSEGPILSNGTAKAWQDCEARCKANFTAGGPCTVWTLLGRDHGTCWFRTDGVYAPVAEYGAFSGYLTPPSAPLPPANIWKADLSGLKLPSEGVTGVRVNGSRMIKARFPNANPEWQGFASNLEASSWTAPTTPVNPTIEFNPPRPHRNNSGQFSQYQLGIGGPCEHFSPQAGYWCGNHTSGGGAFTYRVPSGMVAGKDVFPHMPYANATGAIVQTWRPGHWSSWAFEVGSLDDSTSTWAFTKGGFQGARGDTKGDNVYLQNVVEEMDTSGEWFFDREAQTLYLFHNGTGPPPSARGAPAGTEPAAAVSGTNTLFRIVGTPQSPVRDVSISGLTIRDAGETLLNETVHGMPSGGDWALGRVGAVYAEGTERLSLVGNDVTRCDGNGFLLFGYHRDATISRNSFSWMGETCVALWGKTAGAPGGVDGMGPDGTQGEQPENTMVEGNLAREFGIWEKQSSFFFQAKTGTTTLLSNIAYNGPRAQVNFNDGFRGGNNMTKNILFNSCRESGDHGPFNSWDRQVFEWTGADGKPTSIKDFDRFQHNMIMGGYSADQAIDNDDGSRRFMTSFNAFYAIKSDLKSDFSGNQNHHFGNVLCYIGKGFGAVAAPAGFEDSFTNTTLVLASGGSYGSGQCSAKSGESPVAVGGNAIFTQDGTVEECGLPLAQYQAKTGNDKGSTVAVWPSDADLIAKVRQVLYV